MIDAPTDPHQKLMDMLQAPVVTQAVAVAAELGIADLVTTAPRGVEELAERCDVDSDALYRVLRTLAATGVFDEVTPRVFGPTPMSEALRDGTEDSLRHWARLWGIPERHTAIGALLYSVRTGRPSFPYLHGTDWWAFLAANPGPASIFAAAMGDLSRRLHAATVDAYDLSAAKTLVDIGGGHGHLVATLLRRYPDLRATVLDRPEVVRHASDVVSRAGVADRTQLVGGDFFTSIPDRADVYLMSMIMHDWNDDEASRILATVRRAMTRDSELLIVDAVIPDGQEPHDGKPRDLIMLTMLTGRERTEAQYAALLAGAGMRLREIRAVASSTGLLVAVPQ
ncbi:methyltransferase [Micromonospora sp. DT229]|uniref:methyltransferase n=1 Tax=Micromonospora sp. DT229 TaxID=3393430 RepID=UPI003CE99625